MQRPNENQAIVRNYLRQRGLRIGDRLPGERTIAEALGMGRAALRSVLDDLESEGVLLRRPQSGTFLTAIPLPSVRSAHLAVITPLQGTGQPERASESSWIHRVVSAFERTAATAGARVSLIDQSPFASDPCSVMCLIQEAANSGANAVVFLHALGTRGKMSHALATTSGLGMHPVIVSSRTFCGLGTQVYFDSAWGCCLAVRHLIACGHTQIGFAGAPRGHEWVQDRLKGYQAGLDAADLARRDEWVFLSEEGERLANASDGAAALRHWSLLPADLRPTAIVAANDIVALGLLEAAAKAGISVPDQLSVIGFDNLPESMMAGLTTIDRPTETLGEAVARATLERIAAGTESETVSVRLRPALIERRTVACRSGGGG